MLEKRAALLRAVRDFFQDRGFLEVETPLLCREVVVDRFLDPFAVPVHPATCAADSLYYLQTSPEYGMKRLLCLCSRSIYQITRAFRRDERGQWHNPEFTMLEWYEVGADYQQGMQTTAELADALLGRGIAQRLTYREAFKRYADVDPWEASDAELRERAVAASAADPDIELDRDQWLDRLLVACVAPNLGKDHPTLVYDYPASQAALARIRRDIPPVAERFELYVDGVELANGYHELVDPVELLERMKNNNASRLADGKEPLPIPKRLIEAQRTGFPACTGVALGLDRLVMVALGVSNIDEVLAFPFDIA